MYIEQFCDLYKGWTVMDVIEHTYSQCNLLIEAHNRSEKRKERIAGQGGIKGAAVKGFK